MSKLNETAEWLTKTSNEVFEVAKEQNLSSNPITTKAIELAAAQGYPVLVDHFTWDTARSIMTDNEDLFDSLGFDSVDGFWDSILEQQVQDPDYDKNVILRDAIVEMAIEQVIHKS